MTELMTFSTCLADSISNGTTTVEPSAGQDGGAWRPEKEASSKGTRDAAPVDPTTAAADARAVGRRGRRSRVPRCGVRLEAARGRADRADSVATGPPSHRAGRCRRAATAGRSRPELRDRGRRGARPGRAPASSSSSWPSRKVPSTRTPDARPSKMRDVPVRCGRGPRGGDDDGSRAGRNRTHRPRALPAHRPIPVRGDRRGRGCREGTRRVAAPRLVGARGPCTRVSKPGWRGVK